MANEMAEGRRLIEIFQMKEEIKQNWIKLDGFKNNDEPAFPVKSNRQKQRIIQVIHFIRVKGNLSVDLADVPKRPFNNEDDLKDARLRLHTFETETCISAFKALRNGVQVLKDIARFSRKPPKLLWPFLNSIFFKKRSKTALTAVFESMEYSLSKSSVIEFHSMLVNFITGMEKKCSILQTHVQFYPLFNKVTEWKDIALESIQKDNAPIIVGENNLPFIHVNMLESFIPFLQDFELRNYTRLLVYRCKVLCDFFECLENNKENRVSEFDLQEFYLLDTTQTHKRKKHKTVEKVASNNSSYIDDDRMVVNSESRTNKEAVKTAYDVLSMEGGDQYYYSSANVSRNNSYVPVTPKIKRKGRKSQTIDNSISEPDISVKETSISEQAPVFSPTDEVKSITSPPNNNHKVKNKKYTKKKRSSRSSDNSETSKRQSDQDSNVSASEQIKKLNSFNKKSSNFEQVNGLSHHDSISSINEPKTPVKLTENLQAYSSSDTSTPSELELSENEIPNSFNKTSKKPTEDVNNNQNNNESAENVKTLITKFSSKSSLQNEHSPTVKNKSSSTSEAPKQSTPSTNSLSPIEKKISVTPIPIPRPRSRDSITDMKPATLPRMKKSANANQNNNTPVVKDFTVFSPHPSKIPQPAPRVVTDPIAFGGSESESDNALLSSESSESESEILTFTTKTKSAKESSLTIHKTELKSSQKLKSDSTKSSPKVDSNQELEKSTKKKSPKLSKSSLPKSDSSTLERKKRKSTSKPEKSEKVNTVNEKSDTKVTQHPAQPAELTKSLPVSPAEEIKIEVKTNSKRSSPKSKDEAKKLDETPKKNAKSQNSDILKTAEKNSSDSNLKSKKETLKSPTKPETTSLISPPKSLFSESNSPATSSNSPPTFLNKVTEAVEFKIEFDEVATEDKHTIDAAEIKENIRKSTSSEEVFEFSDKSDGECDNMRVPPMTYPPQVAMQPVIDEFDTDFSLSEYETAIIVDNGSGFCKAGFADEAGPRVVCPTYIGRPRYQTQFTLASTKPDKCYIGGRADGRRGVLNLSYPIEHGIVTNWDDMEQIWHHVFENELRVDIDDHPVLLTEAALNPKANREHIIQIMFEQFQVPAMYLAVQAVLALYGTGTTTGLVLDSGDGVTHVVPVYEGIAYQPGVQRYDIAGRDITAHFSQLLQQNGHSFVSTAEMEIVRNIKEKLCYVALDYEAEDKKPTFSIEKSYIMPDGQEIIVDKPRFQCPEVLFDPSILGKDETSGLHHLILRSLKTCDADLTEEFLSNILLSGGTTMFPGMADRLNKELTGLVSNLYRNKIRINAPENRKELVWNGGAILARSSFFEKSWISTYEYDEFGPSIIHRRAF